MVQAPCWVSVHVVTMQKTALEWRGEGRRATAPDGPSLPSCLRTRHVHLQVPMKAQVVFLG